MFSYFQMKDRSSVFFCKLALPAFVSAELNQRTNGPVNAHLNLGLL